MGTSRERMPVTEADIKALSQKALQKILLKMQDILSEEQQRRLKKIIEECAAETDSAAVPARGRISRELVDEKMKQIREWQSLIDEGDLLLNVEEYEDDSSGYWEADWVTEYYDHLGIGDKIMYMIRFAEDCVEDRYYPEASEIYGWLWEMSVATDEEVEAVVDLAELEDHQLIHMDIERLALLTLYADYQTLPPEKRAEDLYRYFSIYIFSKLHMEDMFHVGRENLQDTGRFWSDWIGLLKGKSGDVETRLLKEAALYCEGTEGLLKIAEETVSLHPSLYRDVLDEYEKGHFYEKIEETGKNALERMDKDLIVRGEIALRAAAAASYLGHEEEMMRFCWECFRSNSTDENYLRLFGTDEMARKYGMRGREVLSGRLKGNLENSWRQTELRRNILSESDYYRLSFYAGDFDKVKTASKNPKGSLGWSFSFIRVGLRLFLLYLYGEPLPSKAAKSIAANVGFPDKSSQGRRMGFERVIEEECSKYKVSEFWNYFQRWKRYYPMEETRRRSYLAWAEEIVYARANAIVSGQHRNQYGEIAALLAMIGEIKESMGTQGAAGSIYRQYKSKFPRHSSFQKEMKDYFGMWG